MRKILKVGTMFIILLLMLTQIVSAREAEAIFGNGAQVSSIREASYTMTDWFVEPEYFRVDVSSDFYLTIPRDIQRIISPVTGVTTRISKEGIDTYALKLGQEIQIDTNIIMEEEIKGIEWSTDNDKVALVNNGKVTAIGTGKVTIKVKYEDIETSINFFVWNTYLYKGQYYTYTNVNRTSGGRSKILKSRVFLATSFTENEKTLKIEDYLYDNGTYGGSKTGNPIGKYIVNYYTMATGENRKPLHFEYSFLRDIEKIELEKIAVAMTVGEEIELAYKLEPVHANKYELAWSSSDEAIATVDSTGKVKAIAAGTAKIIVKSSKNANIAPAECEITVKEPEILPDVEAIEFVEPSAEIEVGKEKELQYKLTPENANKAYLEWSSSDEKIVTVDETGTIKGIAEGTATITVENIKPLISDAILGLTGEGEIDESEGEPAEEQEEEPIKAVCTITVKKAAELPTVEKITFDNDPVEVKVGEESALSYKLTPENANKADLVWSTSDSKIVKVESGTIKGIAVGTAKITVKSSKDEKITATCTVKVVKAEGNGDNNSSGGSGGGSSNSGSDSSSSKVPVTGIKWEYYKSTMTVGESEIFIVNVLPENAKNKNVSWKSMNEAVATVSENGKVTAKKAGTAEIRAITKDGGYIAGCNVIVKAKAEISVTGLKLAKGEMKLTDGGTGTMTAIIEPSNATNKQVTWTSSNTSVATVTANGTGEAVSIKARGVGTSQITAISLNNPNAKATFTVEVKAGPNTVPVTRIEFSSVRVQMDVGTTHTFKVNVLPTNASNKDIVFKSSSPSTLSINQTTGVATANKTGKATITATSKLYENIKISIDVEVKSLRVTGLKLAQGEMNLTNGGTGTMTATIEPSNATNQNITWSSNKTSIATVSTTGKTVSVKATGVGTCIITAKSVDNPNVTATFKVTVKAKANVPVTGVKLSSSTMSLTEGGRGTITAIVSPSNATNKKVTWKTSSANIIRVDENGGVTAVNKGTATITAITEDGQKMATCKVEVKAKPKTVAVSSITIKGTNTMTVGDTKKFTANITPSNASNKSVTWTSSNTSVARVGSNNGNVSALTPGTTTITAKASNGVSKTYKVNVKAKPKTVAVSSIAITKGTTSMTVGTSFTFAAKVSPSNATNKSISWSSSNTGVISITSSGVAVPKKAGTAKITAKASNGKSVSYTVTVKAKTKIPSGASTK